MPEIEGKKRWEVGPCIVTIDENEKIEDASLYIALCAILTVLPAGKGLLENFRRVLAKEELISTTDVQNLVAQAKNRNVLDIDYWKGRPVKLFLRIVDPVTIHVNMNVWTDRFVDVQLGVVIQDLQKVLEYSNECLEDLKKSSL